MVLVGIILKAHLFPNPCHGRDTSPLTRPTQTCLWFYDSVMVAEAVRNFSFHFPFVFFYNKNGGQVSSTRSLTLNKLKGKGINPALFFCTELVQGMRRKLLSASMFWITSDPVSYSQPIISFQLSQHLPYVSCLLWDSHLRYPLEQPEGSSLTGCFAFLSSSFSQKWTLLLLSTSTLESLGHRATARPLG